jgi:general secretion pathway protein G
VPTVAAPSGVADGVRIGIVFVLAVVVISILIAVSGGIFLGLPYLSATRVPQQAKEVAARRQIDAYNTALGVYEHDNGFYPSTEQGLEALITQPTTPPVPANWKGFYLDPPVVRKDPWRHDYIYKCPGTHNRTGYDLYSLGPKGVDGDPGNIGNWD